MMLDVNREAVEKNNPDLLRLLSDCADDGSITVVQSKAGEGVPVVAAGGKSLGVHSRFDPFKEAERLIGEINASQFDLFVVFGFGFAYHIEELAKAMGPESIMLIIEKNPIMIKKAFESRDLSGVIRDGRISILIAPDEESIGAALRGKTSRRVTLIVHRGTFQLDPDYYANVRGMVRSFLSTKEVNIATLAKFEKVWSSNIARNIAVFIDSPGASVFFNAFTNIPAIVVAAGPSLTESIPFIRENMERAVIIAVDTAFKTLLKNGIEPHFCVAVDAQVINARYFEGVKPCRTILVADATVHPSVFRLYQGRRAVTGIAFNIMKWIENITGEKGEWAHGGSVSTNAYDLARHMGASPIVLVGQDLSFTKGYAHVRGSYLDEQIHLKTNRLRNAEMFNRSQLAALPKISVKGIRSGTVHTNQKMMIFLSWFERQRDTRLINATADGACIPEMTHMKSGDIVFNNNINPMSIIERIFLPGPGHGDAGQVRKKFDAVIAGMLADIESLIPSLERGISFSMNLSALLSGGRRDQGKLDFLIKKLSETDAFISSKENIKDMISLTIQRVVHTITEGYDLEGPEAPAGEEMIARRSEYLYRGILEGALFNKKILSKMRTLVGR